MSLFKGKLVEGKLIDMKSAKAQAIAKVARARATQAGRTGITKQDNKKMLDTAADFADTAIDESKKCNLGEALWNYAQGHVTAAKYIFGHGRDISPGAAGQVGKLLYSAQQDIVRNIRGCGAKVKG